MKKTTLQKHVEFFDINNDGFLMPWETYTAFRRLGHSVISSILSAIAIHLVVSYTTQDSWIPDPLFSIKIKNIHRAMHTYDSGVFDSNGEIIEKNWEEFFDKFPNKDDVKFSDVKKIIPFPHGFPLLQTISTMWNFKRGRKDWDSACELITEIKGKVTTEDLKKIVNGSFFKEAAEILKDKQQ